MGLSNESKVQKPSSQDINDEDIAGRSARSGLHDKSGVARTAQVCTLPRLKAMPLLVAVVLVVGFGLRSAGASAKSTAVVSANSAAVASANSSQPESFTELRVLDVQSTLLDDQGGSAIKKYNVHPARKIDCDVLIVGGGIGGVAAALKLWEADKRLKVCLTEETDWLGGQMTAQGVSALDENYLIETTGSCRSYQQVRAGIRAAYRQFGLSALGKSQEYLNPGDSWVTYLAFEPKTALEQLDLSLAEAINSGALQIFRRTKAVRVQCGKNAGVVRSVTVVQLSTGECTRFMPRICLDATELGDLLPMSKTAYRVGSDSKEETGEPHAPAHGNPDNVQDYVFPFVIDFRPGTNNTIAKPPDFDQFNEAKKFSLNDYKMFKPAMLPKEGNRRVESFWSYRRLIAKELFSSPLFPFDVSMVNWDSNDLRGYNIIDKPVEVERDRLWRAKALSLGFLYWLQTEAPRDEGGKGYPELLLRKDVLGSADGLSKFPYIREARRIIAKRMIVEQDIVAATNSGARARFFPDSVGIGFYPVDIHGAQEVRGEGQLTKPFQIPMAALIPRAGGNLLPACKNIGVTHITNGAYRLHHVEWAIGEAQGALAAFCVRHHRSAAAVLRSNKELSAVQLSLVEDGAPVMWFDDLSTDDPAFAPIQFCALEGLLSFSNENLHCNSEDPISLADAARALCRMHAWFDPRGNQGAGENAIPDAQAIAMVRSHGLLKLPNRGAIEPNPQAPLDRAYFERLKERYALRLAEAEDASGPVTRAEFAQWLFALYKRRG